MDAFIADCREAVAQDPSHKLVLDVVRRAFEDPAAVRASMGEPTEGGIKKIYADETLTIIDVVWRPGMSIAPHNHETWAIIGIYQGREDNIWWKRIKDAPDGQIQPAGQQTLVTGDVVPLGKDIIHSVVNPLRTYTGAIHVYGADFFSIPRSQWDEDALTEHVYDISRVTASFKD